MRHFVWAAAIRLRWPSKDRNYRAVSRRRPEKLANYQFLIGRELTKFRVIPQIMSILAGIYSCDKNEPIPDSLCDSLKRLISRNPADEITEFKADRAFFVKLDVGAFGAPGQHEDSLGAVSVLAGEPLLSISPADEIQSRQADLVQIHKGFAASDLGVLSKANGVFCVANYQPDSETLSLATDKLGIRPLYYWTDDKFLIFASALRVLEELPYIPKKMEIAAVTQIAGLGYALGNKTAYIDIFRLRAGEILQINNEVISISRYWRWDDIEISSLPERQLLEGLYHRFNRAVAWRLRTDTSTIAYLSGGLDSRCVVAALRGFEAEVHTFNFARPDTQDQILGRDFAVGINAIHNEIPKDAGDNIPDYSSKMAAAWSVAGGRGSHQPERQNLVWSGEGGSVDLGHVHLDRKIVDLMRAGNTQAAIDEFIRREQIYVSPKLLRSDLSAALSDVIRAGIRNELESIHSADPARNFYLFLMLNDQSRKLAGHFENIDLHRLEFQLPFFDSEFVEFIISIPVDLCLEHKLYVKWLYLFADVVTSVPWQAYPGHEPCPLPPPEGLSYQWADKYQKTEQRSLRRVMLKNAGEILDAEYFPRQILNKTNIRIAVWLHRLGLRDYGYIIETACVYHKYWKLCSGQIDPKTSENRSQVVDK